VAYAVPFCHFVFFTFVYGSWGMMANLPGMTAAIHWGPDPIAFSPFGLDIAWYGILFAVAFLAGHYYMRWVYRREGRSLEDLDRLSMWIILGTIVGARLGHMLFYDFDALVANPISVLYIRDGGLASHGAGIMILAVLLYWGHRHPDQSFIWLLDRIGPVILLGGMFIRLGNFVNGEIYGYVTDLPWGVYFEGPKVPLAERLAPRHPSQLYEAIAVLILFFALHYAYLRRGRSWQAGRLGGLFLVLLFASRCLLEYTKLEQAHSGSGGLISGLKVGQQLSIPFVLIGLWLLFRPARRANAT